MISTDTAMGGAVIAYSYVVPAGGHKQLISVTVNFNVAPTTSESLTITLDSAAGPEYDTLLYTVNPSLASTTDIFWWPDATTYLSAGDAIDVAFTNTDTRVWGLTVTVRGA